MSEFIDDDTRPYPINGKDLPTFVRAMFWLSGALTIVVGLVFIGNAFANQPPCVNDGCIGPSLRWGLTFTINNSLNQNWREIFSLKTSALVENWTPVFFGIISVTSHFPGFSYRFITKTWFHCALWNIFLACFGHLGYSGNLGIIFGCFAIIVSFVCLGMQFTRWRNERPTLHMTTGGLFDRFNCMTENEVMHFFAKAFGLFVGLFTFILGFVSVLTSNFNWCPSPPYTQCFGPSLRWNNGGPNQAFVDDANGVTPPTTGSVGGWRTIFTFDPQLFFPLWGPVFLGYFTIIQHIEGRSNFFYRSWPRVFLWFLFVGMFGNLGYAGGLGIICGFCAIFEAFLALFIAIGGGTNSATAFQINVHIGGGKNQVTDPV